MEDRGDEIVGPDEYYEQLQGMYIEESDLNLSSDFEARGTLVKLKKLESEVLTLKRSVSKDMRAIRNMYLDESIIEKPKLLGLFKVGKKLSRTEKRKKLIEERENNLLPYKEIIDIIDDYIGQIDGLRKYIENEVLETYSRIPATYKKVSKVRKNKNNEE